MIGDRASLLLGSGSWVLALVLAGCGGDKSGDRDGTGGSTGMTGGSAGTGGSTTTMSGGSGGGGGAALMPYPCVPKAPDSPEITKTINAKGEWGGTGFKGGSFTYGDGTDADTVPDITMTFPDASMKVVGNVPTYSGFGVWFAPAPGQTFACIDASGYTGVSFDVVDNSASGTTKTLVVSVQTHDTSPVDVAHTRGGCVYSPDSEKYSDCVYPSATVTVPAGGGVVEVLWSAFMNGKPVEHATVPPGAVHLDGLQWQFPWSDTATAYDADITVKDVKFY